MPKALNPSRDESAAPAASHALECALEAARLVGADPALVLHGGGNTSVKLVRDGIETLFVKGSGADLARVRPDDYTPLDLVRTRALLDADLPDNTAMYRALAPCVLTPGAPRPSIETLMHAALPAAHVIHTHTASILALANSADGARALAAALGNRAPVVPYHHSGVALARACRDAWRRADPARAIGLVLDHHGALAVGRDAREARERTLELAQAAEDWLCARDAPGWRDATAQMPAPPEALQDIARLRAAACRAAGRRLVATRFDGGDFGAFIRRPDAGTITARGPSTPGHAIHTKCRPQVGRDVAAYARAYRDHLGATDRVDPAPRVLLDPAFGMLALGVTARHARIAAEIFIHDCAIMARAEVIGGYRTIDAAAMRAAEIEYAGFEARVTRELPQAGTVHVLGAGRHDRAGRLLGMGACVALLDAPPSMAATDDPACLVVPAGLDDPTVLALIVGRFGGIDHADLAPGRLPDIDAFPDLAHA